MRRVGFSVVIPTCNRPQLALRAVKSVLNQSYDAVEIIVVNNGSSSASKAEYDALFNDLKDKITYIDLNNDYEIGFGPSAARNIAVKIATKEYIAFCDDDDEWTNVDYLQTVSEFLAVHHQQVIFSDQQAVSVDGTLIKKNWFNRAKLIQSPKVDDFDGFFNVTASYFYRNGGFPHLNSTIYSRELLLENNGFCKFIDYEEDFELFHRLVAKVDRLVYWDAVVSRHFIPEQCLNSNLTTRMSWLHKQKSRLYICNHLIFHSDGNKELVDFSIKHGNYTIKAIIENALSDGDKLLALSMANQLLGWQGFSCKNIIYYLNVKLRVLTKRVG